MTEAEWLDCERPTSLLQFVEGSSLSSRKLRLFACACCRATWELLMEQPSRDAVEVSERFADGETTRKAVEMARRTALGILPPRIAVGTPEEYAAIGAAMAARSPRKDQPRCYGPSQAWGGMSPAWRDVDCLRLIRCIFGNPFLPVSFDAGFRTRDVVALAQAAYKDRLLPKGHLDGEVLAVLSDALEEAGCVEQSMLSHLRDGKVHVRGCWVVDSILSRP
jgi:hypothetical protein